MLARYKIQLEYMYITEKDNSIADALRRIDPLSLEPQDAKQIDAIQVYQITDPIPAKDNRLDRTRIASTADPTQIIVKSLAIEDRLIFKAHHLIIPTSQRTDYLRDLPAGHLGEEKTLLWACEIVFWPGVSDDIRNTVKACGICQKHKPAQQKEPLKLHDVMSTPWVKLRINIFEHHSHH